MKFGDQVKENSRVGVKIVISIMLVSMLASCAPTNIVIKDSLPAPMVKKIPVTMGVYYPDAFVNFVHKETAEEIGDWQIDLGEQNAGFFRSLFGSMFAKTIVIENRDGYFSAAPNENTQAVLVPQIKKYGFLTPSVSGLGFYSASIEYELTLYDDKGEVIFIWAVVGYGKSEGRVFGKEEAVEQATLLAIRDAGARIAIEFDEQKAFTSWLESLEKVENVSEI